MQLYVRGPYPLVGQGENTLFECPEVHGRGVNLWTVSFESGFLCYYVGETGRSFHQRTSEHARDYLSGLWHIYDPEQFALGRKTLVWDGMWRPGTKDKMGQFLERLPELGPFISEYLRLLQIFLIPFGGERRVRERIEAAIADHLNLSEQ